MDDSAGISLQESPLVDVSSLESSSMVSSARNISMSRWACIMAFQFMYAVINTGMALYVLPAEAQHMNPESASVWVGIYVAVCGTTQLFCPIAGKLSDRHSSRFGRRRPYIVGGAAVAIFFFTLMLLASVLKWNAMYILALFPAQLGLNITFAAQSALPADIQQERRRRASSSPSHRDAESPHSAGHVQEPDAPTSVESGSVSGIVAVLTLLGSLTAVALMVATRSWPVQSQYPLYIVGLTLTIVLVCCSVKEDASVGMGQLTFAEVRRVFFLDLSTDTDFVWVCVGRLCYYIVTSTVVFQLYYLEDMMGVVDESRRQVWMGIMVLTAQLVGASLSLPLGRLSDRVGRKKVIYFACFFMALASLLYILAPVFTQTRRHSAIGLMLLSCFCAGVGNSAYLAVDYALALDCLPAGKSSAESFGLWGVAGFLGSSIGPLLGGALLQMNSTEEQGHYTLQGYSLVMLVLGVGMCILVAGFTSRIVRAK